jgi:hypothetical protein
MQTVQVCLDFLWGAGAPLDRDRADGSKAGIYQRGDAGEAMQDLHQQLRATFRHGITDNDWNTVIIPAPPGEESAGAFERIGQIAEEALRMERGHGIINFAVNAVWSTVMHLWG